MNDTSPPQYSSASACTPAILVNLAPPPDSDAASFQLGFLGHGPAFVAGEVQVKYAGTDEEPRPAFRRLEVCFKGVENAEVDAIDLFDQRQVLWGDGAAGSSAAGGTSEASFPPSSTAFKIELTPDLPVCIHAPTHSSLTYTLTATLYPSDPDALPLVRCAPVHLVRTSPPGSLVANLPSASLTSSPPSTSPRTVSTTTPIAFSVRLPRTVFRRSEPVELMTRIEVPDAKAVREGLRLRTVSAELVRTITVVGVSHSRASSADAQGDAGGSEATKPQVHRTVLAHSGKSARFSPSRPIIIRLVLHPPTEPSCESITQSTILHTVSFAVVVTIGLVSVTPTSHAGSPVPDAVLSQDVFLLPDTPSARSDKQKEVDREVAIAPPPEAWSSQDMPVPTYVERSEHDPGESAPASSGSSSWPLHLGLGLGASTSATLELHEDVTYGAVYPTDGDDEEEYDGYEELSLPATLSTRLPPPAIDADVSPPSAGEPSSVAGLALAAARGGLIDEEEEGETPPPDDFAAYDAPPALPSSLGDVGDPSGAASDAAAPPSFDARRHDLEPTTPPPPIDFLPLPSTPPEQPSPPHPADPRPPGSPLSTRASGAAHGLPPPYFTRESGEVPPPPRDRHARAASTASSSAGNAAGAEGELGREREGAVEGEREGEGVGEGEGEGDEPRPPPYEQREARDGLVHFGVNRHGELVL